MQSVVLGLRDSVLQSLAPWLCHDCGDCSTTCPREAEPRQSMMTLRHYLTAQYEWTGLAGRICRSPAAETAALSSVALLVLGLIILYHLTIVHLDLSVFGSTAMGLEHMFPRITYFTLCVFLIPVLFVLANAFRMFRFTMRRGTNAAIPLRCYLAEAKTLLLNTVAHVQILKCAAKDHKKRWTMHWLLAFGCVLMVVIKFFFLRWFQTDRLYPIYHPQRWLGYLGAVCLVGGAVEILVGRMRKQDRAHRSSHWGDLTLPVLLLLTALSGITVHILRYAGLVLAADYAYAIHLMIAVPMLIVEVPFGQWSHMIYRPMALYFSAVQARALAEQEAKEALAA
jgi:ferredoxin